jgi:putative ABC transport system ATP-binding protein
MRGIIPDMAVAALFRLRGVRTQRGTGPAHVHPLNGVDVDLAAGRVTAVVGPSGSGKSTLLRVLNRMEEPVDGEVLLHGAPLRSLDVLDLRRRVGLLLQRPVPFAGTVLDNLRAGAPGVDRDAAAALLERAGLPAAFVDRDAHGLSGGEAQRMCLARALAVGPEVLLMDEPTSALDRFAASAVEATIDRLRADGVSVVVVSHDLRQARRVADDAVVVVAGRVAESGPASAVLHDPVDERARAFVGGSA